jgi:D-glycero-alpha-D-manno-heptose 1-phosphate guanylyltransferase
MGHRPGIRISDVTAIVLAGGLGTRVAALYPDIPKPMIPFDGEPFLAFLVEYVRSQGIERIVLSTGYRGEIVDTYFAEVKDVFCLRETDSLGTGGALRDAVRSINPEGPVIALNGDSFAPFRVEALVSALNGGAEISLGAVEVNDAARFGVLEIDSRGRLKRFVEKDGVRQKGLINAGIYLFRTAKLLASSREGVSSLEKELFPEWLSSGTKVATTVIDGPFLDIGTPETLKEGREFFRRCRQYISGLDK